MLAYPTREQFAEAISIVIEIVRKGEIIKRKVEFSQGLWVSLGFLQSIVVGDPVAPMGTAGYKPMLTELKSSLQSVIDDELLTAGFDWAFIVQLIKLIMELIDQFRD